MNMIDRIITLHRDIFHAPIDTKANKDYIQYTLSNTRNEKIITIHVSLNDETVTYYRDGNPTDWNGNKHWNALTETLTEHTAEHIYYNTDCFTNGAYVDIITPNNQMIRFCKSDWNYSDTIINFWDTNNKKHALHRYTPLKAIVKN